MTLAERITLNAYLVGVGKGKECGILLGNPENVQAAARRTAMQNLRKGERMVAATFLGFARGVRYSVGISPEWKASQLGYCLECERDKPLNSLRVCGECSA